MKKMILSALVAFAGSQASAAQLETCIDRVVRNCGGLGAILAYGSVSSNECSVVQSGTREDGTRYSEKIIFKDRDTVASISLDRCDLNRKTIHGRFKEQKQFKGRLFSVTQDGRVIVVGRDNGIVQLLNSKNKPYVSVVDIKMLPQAVELTFENGQSTELDAEEVLERLNHRNAQL